MKPVPVEKKEPATKTTPTGPEEKSTETQTTAEEEFMKDVRRLFFLNAKEQSDNSISNSFYSPYFYQ